MSKKEYWYATINRGGNNVAGTKIRISPLKQPKLIAFLQEQWQQVIDLHEKNPDTTPSFQVNDEAWETFSEELRKKKEDPDKFTKIFSGTNEVCVIAHEDYRLEIMKNEELRLEAEEQRRVDAKIEELKEEE